MPRASSSSKRPNLGECDTPRRPSGGNSRARSRGPSPSSDISRWAFSMSRPPMPKPPPRNGLRACASRSPPELASVHCADCDTLRRISDALPSMPLAATAERASRCERISCHRLFTSAFLRSISARERCSASSRARLAAARRRALAALAFSSAALTRCWWALNRRWYSAAASSSPAASMDTSRSWSSVANATSSSSSSASSLSDAPPSSSSKLGDSTS